MGAVGEYLIGVSTAAIICAVVKKLANRGTLAGALRLLTGAFLALAVLSPWVSVKWESLQDFAADFRTDAEVWSQEGQQLGEEALRQVIKERTAAYILDKAKSLGASVTVEVGLNDKNVPAAVTVTGALSPSARGALAVFMEDTLGIGREGQIWKN